MNDQVMVHIIGTYVPESSGEDGLSECNFFQRLFVNTAAKYGGGVIFIKTIGAKALSSMKKDDIIILLNPSFVTSGILPAQSYKTSLRKAVEIVGRGRTILAFQDTEAKKNLCLSSSIPSLWEITYAPVFSTTDKIYKASPSPEEAVSIMEKILDGKNPDVYL